MNALIQESLLATKHVNHAAIIRLKDSAIKAKSPHFQLTEMDVAEILHAFEHPRELRAPTSPGLVIFDTTFKAVRADAHAIYGKNLHDKSGIIISKTTGHLILGTWDASMQASLCAEAVERLGDYFRKGGK